MTRNRLALVAAFALQTLSLAAPLGVAHASPAIQILDESEVARRTDVRARVRVVAVERTERDGRVELRSLVRVVSSTGRNARALRAGALVTFRASCSTAPIDDWMLGYPNDRCGASWWRMPDALTHVGRHVDLALAVSRDGTGRPAFSVVPATWPPVGHAFGELGDRRLDRANR